MIGRRGLFKRLGMVAVTVAVAKVAEPVVAQPIQAAPVAPVVAAPPVAVIESEIQESATMRVRMLVDQYHDPYGKLRFGDRINIPDDLARQWVELGIASYTVMSKEALERAENRFMKGSRTTPVRMKVFREHPVYGKLHKGDRVILNVRTAERWIAQAMAEAVV